MLLSLRACLSNGEAYVKFQIIRKLDNHYFFGLLLGHFQGRGWVMRTLKVIGYWKVDGDFSAGS